MAATVGCGEVSMFKGIVELVFVFFSNLENEWSKSRILVSAVLFPCSCSPHSDDDTCTGFAYFYCRCVDGNYYCLLVVGLQRNWLRV